MSSPANPSPQNSNASETRVLWIPSSCTDNIRPDHNDHRSYVHDADGASTDVFPAAGAVAAAGCYRNIRVRGVDDVLALAFRVSGDGGPGDYSFHYYTHRSNVPERLERLPCSHQSPKAVPRRKSSPRQNV